MRALIFALLVACSTTEVGAPPPEPATAPVEEPAVEEPAPQPVEVDAVEEGEPPVDPAPTPPPEPPPPPTAGSVPDGSACLTAAECASGICEGQGCEASSPGTCAQKQRACTRDRRAYCGCDGETFFSSGSCPGRRYAKTGTCE